MATGRLAPVLRYIRRVSGAAGEEDGNRALLDRFARHGDAEAFAALVRRHGPMVLAVCRRVLRDAHDAEDAFQAVFLLLVRRAGSLRRPEQLGPWLHGVALRVALKARSVNMRRREHPQPLPDAPAPPAPDELAWRDLHPILDDAVRSLPAKYRAPFVLCYLEGMTHAEAARQLGCPPGTVATRLARARAQLRARLVRRGVMLSATALAVVLARGAASAPLPARLFGGVARALASPCTIPSHVTALTEGVCKAMLMEKLRFVWMALVAAAAVGFIVMGYRSGAAEPPLPAPPAAPALAVPPAEKEEVAATVRTKNFTVTAPTGRIARLIAEAAERHRKEKAILWLGEELPAWPESCAIMVRITPQRAGGATTFTFDSGKVTSRSMHVEGALDRLLGCALPHEVMHTVLADLFGAPLPRWADEGVCVLSEDVEEQQRHAHLMGEIAGTPRMIPASRLLGLKEYPDDVMALWAEGYSLTRFLIEKKDRKTFLAFVKQGARGDWDRAVKEHYGFRDVDELERAWLDQVRKGEEVEVVQYGMPFERTGLPEEGPLPGVARLQPDGKGVTLDIIRTHLHYRMTTRRCRDGRSVSGLEPLVTHRRLEIALPLAEVAAYRADGTALDPKKLPDLLNEGTPVLVAPQRSAIHARFLQLVKGETLLIIVKASHLAEGKESPAPEEPSR